MSLFQDVTKSVDQLCTQLSVAHVIVPKFNSDIDVYDFISEYELATISLPDEQKKSLLPKAFAHAKSRAWFENDLKPNLPIINWQGVKNKIISRFARLEDCDRHLSKVNNLKYHPEQGHKLLDFIDELHNSFEKAYISINHKPDFVRQFKCSLPTNVTAKLNLIPGFESATNKEELQSVAKKYDMSFTNEENSNQVNKAGLTQITTALEKMMSNLQQEIKNNRQEFMALAYQGSQNRASYNQQSNQESYGDRHQYDRNRSPDRRSFHNYDYNNKRYNYNYQSRSPRSFSPVHRNHMSPENQGRYNSLPKSPRSYSPVNRNSMEPERQLRPRSPSYPAGQMNPQEEDIAFDNSAYFAKFGKPPTPCSNCKVWHWSRHCPVHLN